MKNKHYQSGAQRSPNEGKPRYDLLIPLTMKEPMLRRCAELMGRGAVRFGDRNWEKASTQEDLDRFRESAFRHFVQWFMGQTDEDHAAAVFFNIQGAEYVREKLGDNSSS